ncbi:MAG: M2 family metallopeptidase [Colwellia sp.]|nr:M2 family metallopeptidase [Colwellia sp.]
MNKLTHAAKHTLLVSSLAVFPFANAAKNTSSVTINKATAFIEAADIAQKELVDTGNLAWYIKDRFRTLDTENHIANLIVQGKRLDLKLGYQANQYKNLNLNKDLTRRLNGILSAAYIYPSHPHPQNKKKVTILKKITRDLAKKQADNTACIDGDSVEKECLNAQQLAKKMTNSTDENELKVLWTNWHNNLTPLKSIYQQQVQLNNEGAQRFGFSNRAEMQLSQFEMPVDDFINELDQAWADVKPLYDSLLLHVRNKLIEKYGADVVKPNQPIPAHLLGSLNVNNLSNLYELVKPEGAVKDRGYNIEEKLKEYPELDTPAMLHGLEKYIMSMGFTPFKKSLYEFSQFTKPTSHDASCDPSAWWLPENEEARVGGCWEINEDTFMRFNTTSLLTPMYFRAAHAEQPGHYSIWPAGTFRGTNRAFQYAYTPDYLQSIGMLDEIPDESADLGYLMQLALNTVASMPYKLAVNKWQKEIASGEISPKEYNNRWWQLREHYQGITAPVDRDNNAFDAGAIPAIIHNQNQAGSFIGEILGFQFYQSLCEAAGNKNTLSRCSFYGSKDVGKKLQAMFELGNSQPWFEVMSEVTGQTKLDGSAITNYFKTLQKYLDQQNEN